MIPLNSFQKKRFIQLLHMNYTVGDLAEIGGVPQTWFEQALLKDCPFQVEAGKQWIIGTAFQKWAGIPVSPHKPHIIIHRENWLAVCAFLKYNEQVLQLDPKTVKRKRTHLRHLLEWAGNLPFAQAVSIRPTFPAYLIGARNDRQKQPLSAETLDRGCEEARRFFTWIVSEHSDMFPLLTVTWIKSIHPDRAHGRQSELKKRDVFTLEDVRKIAKLKPDNLTEQRDQAAVCFLFLSGMRADAFVTLPIKCVDLENNQVKQLPAYGVRTKNHQAAITHLLLIDDLWEVVRTWDQLVRSALSPESLWYATLNTGRKLNGRTSAGSDRRSFLTKGLRRLCEKAGVTYHSPHKLRHGHAVYGIKHAKNMQDFKAISQNLMHSSIAITDGIYGNLTVDDVKQTLANLGSQKPMQSELGLLFQALSKLQDSPELLKQILGG